MLNPTLVRVLARAFLTGESQIEQIVAHSSLALGRAWPWLLPLAQRYLQWRCLQSKGGEIRPRQKDVTRFLANDLSFQQAAFQHAHELSVRQWLTEPESMLPVLAARAWDLPPITSVGALADWFWLEYGDLDWFADVKGLNNQTSSPQLGHYNYRLLLKRSGGIRLIESPKPRLKRLQREILGGILDQIPAHPAAHGFIKGRSIQTFVAPHVGQSVVLRMDLQDFFANTGGARIQTFFRMLGYPEPVADLLGGICTNAAPAGTWNKCKVPIDWREVREARELYMRLHLPQGAPTSPALANVCAYRLDCRLTGLAKIAGATYTRYADDLAFSGSGGFQKSVERFSVHVAVILLEEGYRVNYRKTRIMLQGVRQHLAGLVTNQKVNVSRSDFDCLKATLMNCVRFGPKSQNHGEHPAFRSHLEGRMGFVTMINPSKGARLRLIFERIHWE